MKAAVFAAALLASAEVCAQTATPPPPPEGTSAEAMETARRLFVEGVDAAQGGRWDEARERFSRALQIHPAPSIRFNLALANQNLGRLVEAIEQYRQFLRETPDRGDPERVAAARAQVELLAPRLAQLRVETTGDAPRSFQLDGRTQPLAMLGVDIPVNPGPHTVDVEGNAGDHQRREGAVYEAERMRVVVELSPTPPIRARGTWQPRAQPFGHWVARPGPDGRWIDWAARATAQRTSVWELHPLTLAAQAGVGAPAGVVSLSARYFPQPWFGAELALGVSELGRPMAGVFSHARLTGALSSHHALGLMVGASVASARLSIGCERARVPMQGVSCNDFANAQHDVLAVMLAGGLTSEWRLGPRWTLRATAGLRVTLNPADFRAHADPYRRLTCESAGFGGAAPPVCDLVNEETPVQPLLNPFAAVDFGYSF